MTREAWDSLCADLDWSHETMRTGNPSDDFKKLYRASFEFFKIVIKDQEEITEKQMGKIEQLTQENEHLRLLLKDINKRSWIKS